MRERQLVCSSHLAGTTCTCSPLRFPFAEWGVSTKQVMKFIADGGNVFATTGPSVSTAFRNFAAELGISVAPAGHRVVDHVTPAPGDAGYHTRIATTAYGDASATQWVLGSDATTGPFVFDGVALSTSPDNYLAFPVVTGGATALSQPLGKAHSGPATAGQDAVLVMAAQGRTNSRVILVGSTWAVSDAAAALQVDGATVSNGRALLAAAQWAFQARGVLRASNIWHQHASGSPPAHQLHNKSKSTLPRSMYPEPEAAPQSLVYRIKEDVQYFVDLHVWEGDSWQPLVRDDVQLEFVMLDPHVRQALKYTGNGTYMAEFMTPDNYGVFKFRLMYRRHGLSTVSENRQVTVRRFWHNEYERYIPSAFPYYLAVFSMMAGFFVFSLVFLFTKPGVAFTGAPSGKGKAKKD